MLSTVQKRRAVRAHGAKIGIDFETYFSTKEKYSLRNMTAEEYINSTLFEIIMVSIKIGDAPAYVVDGKDREALADHLRSLPWDTSAAYAHNGSFFDFLILGWCFGIFPAFYLDTLLMARPIAGTGEANTLAALAERFGLPNKLDTIYAMDGLRRADMSDEQYADYSEYCTHDIELAHQLLPPLMDQWRSYDLAWMDITMRMAAQPVFRLDPQIIAEGLNKEDEREGQQLYALFEVMDDRGIEIPKEAWDKVKRAKPEGKLLAALKKAVGSADMFASIMEQFGIEPPEKWSDKQMKWVYAFSRSDGDFMDLADTEIEGARELVEARLGVKSTIMHSRLTRLGGIARRMGVLPIPIMPFAAHCVPGETEVFTPDGWVRLDRWDGGDIMQFDAATGGMSFLPGTVYAGPIVSAWVHQTGKFAQAPMTPGHTVPYYADTGARTKVLACRAEALLTRSRTRLVEAGLYESNGTLLTPAQARVVAMVQADGNFQTNASGTVWLRLKFKKDRKVIRCADLFHAAGVRYSVHPEGTATTFVVRVDDMPEWLIPERKVFGQWCMGLSAASMDAILDECVHWDGTTRADNATRYTSSIRGNVEWISTLGHLRGRPTGRIIVETDKRSGGEMFVVSLRRRSRSYSVEPKSVELRREERQAWCARTQTGFWLARYRGKVFVTGNTGRNGGTMKVNVQNFSSRPGPSNPYGKANPCRRTIHAPDDHLLYDADLSQIEVRVLGGVSGEPNILIPFGDEKNCPYCAAGPLILGKEVIKGVHKQERNILKAAILGNGYGQGGPGFQGYAKRSGIILEAHESQRIVDAYRNANPYVVDLWDACEWALDRIMEGKGGTFGHNSCLRIQGETIILPSGRPIRYRSMRWSQRPDKRTGRMKRVRLFYDPVKRCAREVYGSLTTENIVQGIAADVVHEMGVDLLWSFDLAPRLQVHDSLVFVEPTRRHDYILSALPKVMKKPRPWMDWIPLNYEVEVGKSYGDLEEVK